MTAELCIRFACVSITPRGSPVDPEVYCSIARSAVDGGAAVGSDCSLAMADTSSQATSGVASPSASQLSSRAASAA